ncbi:hypothetical protein RF644_17740 [Kocuria sp. CPCC 205258]|uniref:hypothetical protein n=1 Tax=Kocuria sp. CPCC 205258 TaxID=3073552 RepID=UPI0034D74FF0
MGLKTKAEGLSGGRLFLLSIAAFLVWFYASDWLWDLLASFADWLVSIGGYGLSNAVFAALVGAGCFAGLEITRRRLRRVEVDGDPEPINPPYDYETTARPSVWLGWTAGVVCWVAGFVILTAGYPHVFIIGPVIGTTAVLAGRMEASHARAMDARRGMPPAVAGPG